MPITGRQVAVTASATELARAKSDTGTNNVTIHRPTTVTIRNRGTTSVFIGGASVTITTGFEIPAAGAATPDTPVVFELLDGGDVLYGIAAASGTVHVLEQD